MKNGLNGRHAVRALVTSTLAATALAAAAPASATLNSNSLLPGQLVISEIMVDPTKVGDASGEWFEVFNPFGIAIDLNGMVVESQTGTTVENFTIKGNAIIEPGDYFVFGRNANTATNGGLAVDYAWGNAISFGNSTDFLRIERPDGQILVQANWSSPAAGRSIELRNGVVPAFGPGAFGSSTVAYGLGDFGTPGFANSAPMNLAGLVAPPVPEPETYALMAMGLGCIGLARRRNRR